MKMKRHTTHTLNTLSINEFLFPMSIASLEETEFNFLLLYFSEDQHSSQCSPKGHLPSGLVIKMVKCSSGFYFQCSLKYICFSTRAPLSHVIP